MDDEADGLAPEPYWPSAEDAPAVGADQSPGSEPSPGSEQSPVAEAASAWPQWADVEPVLRSAPATPSAIAKNLGFLAVVAYGVGAVVAAIWGGFSDAPVPDWPMWLLVLVVFALLVVVTRGTRLAITGHADDGAAPAPQVVALVSSAVMASGFRPVTSERVVWSGWRRRVVIGARFAATGEHVRVEVRWGGTGPPSVRREPKGGSFSVGF